LRDHGRTIVGVSTGRTSLDRSTSPGEASNRAAKRDRLRAAVEQVALELFREHGFDDVTVEQIASEAGIGATTFYRYFGTKDGALFAYQARWMQQVREAAEMLDVGRPRPQQLHDLLLTLVDNFAAELEAMQVRDEIVARNPRLLPTTLAVQRAWEQELASSLAKRRSRPLDDPTVHMDAALVHVVVRMAFRRWRAGAVASLTEGVAVSLEAAQGALARSCQD
jgi:TetR/AcrR family transcriptional regulator, regulator of mycofactocin system